MKDISKYHWVLYLIGVFLSLISNFFPAIYSTPPIIYPEEYFVNYFVGLTLQYDSGMYRFNLYGLIHSLFPLILFITAIVKISFLTIKQARGREIDSKKIFIYTTLLMGAILSYILIITLSSLVIGTKLTSIWERANIGFGLIGPLIGAIIIYLGYFLGRRK